MAKTRCNSCGYILGHSLTCGEVKYCPHQFASVSIKNSWWKFWRPELWHIQCVKCLMFVLLTNPEIKKLMKKYKEAGRSYEDLFI